MQSELSGLRLDTSSLVLYRTVVFGDAIKSIQFASRHASLVYSILFYKQTKEVTLYVTQRVGSDFQKLDEDLIENPFRLLCRTTEK